MNKRVGGRKLTPQLFSFTSFHPSMNEYHFHIKYNNIIIQLIYTRRIKCFSFSILLSPCEIVIIIALLTFSFLLITLNLFLLTLIFFFFFTPMLCWCTQKFPSLTRTYFLGVLLLDGWMGNEKKEKEKSLVEGWGVV